MSTSDNLETISFKEAANQLNLSESKVGRMIEEQALISIKIDKERRIPASLIKDGEVLPALRGTLILLADIGLSSEEVVNWLLSENDYLSETPLQALEKGHKAPVRRAAQLLAENY